MRRAALLLSLVLFSRLAIAAAGIPLVLPAHRVDPEASPWRELAEGLRESGAATADFTEKRWFPFKTRATVLRGEVRVSATHGLSLHYFGPPDRIVVIDAQGMLVRSVSGDAVPPADARAEAANFVLLHILRLDLRPLAAAFEIYGVAGVAGWRLALVPRTEAGRQGLGQIDIAGEGAAVRRIELRRSATQRVEIVVAPPRLAAAYPAAELRKYFRGP